MPFTRDYKKRNSLLGRQNCSCFQSDEKTGVERIVY